jgi:hypothetical protein
MLHSDGTKSPKSDCRYLVIFQRDIEIDLHGYPGDEAACSSRTMENIYNTA